MKHTSRLWMLLGAGLAGILVLGMLVPAAGQDRKAIDRDLVEFAPWPPMRVSLDVLVDNQPLPTVFHQGKTYVPVPRLGLEYAIRVTNHGPRRVVAMVSVDGLSVLNGQPASEDQAGYVVAARGSILIKGWRRDMNTVAVFSFVEREKSYASLMGRPENVGVIGLIAVEEMTSRPVPRPFVERNGKSAAPALQRATVGDTGTGYGRDVDSRIYYVPFVRSNNKRTITMYYDTVATLRAAGVPVDRPLPSPFPGDHEFAPPPPADKSR